MYKLDYQKWRKDLDNAMAEKNADQVTWLHVIRAQILGKQHRHRARGGWDELLELGKLNADEARELAVNGGSMIVAITPEDEAYVIGESWKNYVIEIAEKVPSLKESLLDTFWRILRGR